MVLLYNPFVEKKKKIPLRHIHLLFAVAEANRLGYEMSEDGLVSLLTGSATVPFALWEADSFGYLPSKRSKSIKLMIATLERQGYLAYDYAPGVKNGFLRLSEEVLPMLPMTLNKRKATKAKDIQFRKIERK